jgi:hypothetical protein
MRTQRWNVVASGHRFGSSIIAPAGKGPLFCSTSRMSSVKTM